MSPAKGPKGKAIKEEKRPKGTPTLRTTGRHRPTKGDTHSADGERTKGERDQRGRTKGDTHSADHGSASACFRWMDGMLGRDGKRCPVRVSQAHSAGQRLSIGSLKLTYCGETGWGPPGGQCSLSVVTHSGYVVWFHRIPPAASAGQRLNVGVPFPPSVSNRAWRLPSTQASSASGCRSGSRFPCGSVCHRRQMNVEPAGFLSHPGQATVRMPGRKVVALRVGSDPLQRATAEIHDIQFVVAVAVAGECNPRTIAGECRADILSRVVRQAAHLAAVNRCSVQFEINGVCNMFLNLLQIVSLCMFFWCFVRLLAPFVLVFFLGFFPAHEHRLRIRYVPLRGPSPGKYKWALS